MSRREGAFAGQDVVITGAAGGLGAALARAFARVGARLALLDLAQDGLDVVAGQPELAGCTVVTRVCDVRDPAACRDALAHVRAELGGVDVLVNNAGITHRSPFARTDLDVLRRVMDVNFFGAVHCTQAALPSLVERRGQVVAISSVAGFAPLLGRTGYAASKHALHGFFDTLRAELGPAGVDVLVACPGFTDTGLARRALAGDGHLATHPQAAVGKPADPDEVAERIVAACAARRRLLVLGPVGKLSYWLTRLAPRLYERLMVRSQRSEAA